VSIRSTEVEKLLDLHVLSRGWNSLQRTGWNRCRPQLII
jgi:hypothetical protein